MAKISVKSRFGEIGSAWVNPDKILMAFQDEEGVHAVLEDGTAVSPVSLEEVENAVKGCGFVKCAGKNRAKAEAPVPFLVNPRQIHHFHHQDGFILVDLGEANFRWDGTFEEAVELFTTKPN